MFLLLLAAAGAIAAAVSATLPAAPQAKPQCRTKLPTSALTIVKKWAQKRNIPYSWILATIAIESCNNQYSAGDAGGKSVGYMQVNTVAHAAAMAREGVTREKMFDPEINIDWGTRVMRQAIDEVQKAYVAKGVTLTQQQLGQVMRVYYKGPAYVMAAIAAGKDPRVSAYAGAPAAVAKWDRVLVETQAFV